MAGETKYIVAFSGRRDRYQVPLALAAAVRLERFVTSAYNAGWRAKLSGRLSKRVRSIIGPRCREGIPDALVASHWSIELLQHLSGLVGDKQNRSWQWADRAISRAASRLARRTGASLLLYEPYAWEAFTATYRHAPRKVLFHFHLHPRFERRLIAEDLANHPPGPLPWTVNDAISQNDCRVVTLWQHADLVLCASSFTKRSLVEEGMPPEKAVVVPYGIDIPADYEAPAPPLVFSALFVGSGIQRKGLHHLLRAWSTAELPDGATLTLVCRTIDPALEDLLREMPSSVRLLRGVPGVELDRLFRESSLFVMPSFAEGFGQVYLEAMARGCPVLGTTHTCLPDLGGEEDGIFLVPAGEVNSLRTRLESLAKTLTEPESITLRRQALALARAYTWERFRDRLLEVIFTPPSPA